MQAYNRFLLEGHLHPWSSRPFPVQRRDHARGGGSTRNSLAFRNVWRPKCSTLRPQFATHAIALIVSDIQVSVIVAAHALARSLFAAPARADLSADMLLHPCRVLDREPRADLPCVNQLFTKRTASICAAINFITRRQRVVRLGKPTPCADTDFHGNIVERPAKSSATHAKLV